MEQAVADAAFLLSRCFSYPDEALCGAFLSGEAVAQVSAALEGMPHADGVPAGTRALLAESAAALESRRDASSPEDAFHAMRVDYTMALNGMPKPAVQPYESVFRGEAEGRRVLLMVDDVAEQVRSAYKRAGVVAQNASEPCDHVSTELEFLGLLADRGDDNGFQEFFDAHCVSWMPAFADAVLAETGQGSHLRFAAAALLFFSEAV